jgi:CBS domain-containing protein
MGIPREIWSPLTVIEPGKSIMEAARLMKSARAGALVVMDGGKMAGIISERDIMTKVVAEKRDAAATKVRDVMVSPVLTVREEDSVEGALQHMSHRHIRHLPLVDKDGKPEAILSIRDLLRFKLKEMEKENESLEAFLTADGPGG